MDETLTELERMELRYLDRHGPLWCGLLRDEGWKEDHSLLQWLKRGWVRKDGDGFRITEDGRRAYQLTSASVANFPQRLRRALAVMSDVNAWLGKHDGHVEAVKLGQAMRDVRWVLVGLEGGQDGT